MSKGVVHLSIATCVVAVAAVAVGGAASSLMATQANNLEKMSFFITSKGSGDGANLGGIAGADTNCLVLATIAGAPRDKVWRAYLSATGSEGRDPINARDRIGAGPWYNAQGVMIAENVDDLHSDNNNLTKETQLTEMGQQVNGRGDTPNQHDILTGSDLQGRLAVPESGEGDLTCSNWTSNSDGSAMVGHHDRNGGGANPTSWNSAHGTRGCSQEALVGTGGNGYYYCFAIN